MNKHEKATKYLHSQGFTSASVCGPTNDLGVFIAVWNDELQESCDVRIHDEEVDYLASQA